MLLQVSDELLDSGSLFTHFATHESGQTGHNPAHLVFADKLYYL